MSVSLLFSIVIFGTAINETRQRLIGFEEGIYHYAETNTTAKHLDLRNQELNTTARNMAESLVYMNLLVLAAGGLGAYFLARRTLRPISEALAAQQRFTSDASHEFRTPLANMKMELELALRDPHMSKKDMAATMESTLEEINSLTELTSVLLALAAKDEQNNVVEKTSISQLLHRTRERFSADASRIHITQRSATSRYNATINPASMMEIFTIIIDNALKYSYPNTPITLHLQRRPGRIVVQITNKGKGIAAKDIPHIFTRFYQSDSSRSGHTHPTRGYGLGLALAQKLIKLNRSTISVQSKPGESTTFTLSLPQ